jgi:uncharacterized protein (DUF1499 family)
MKSPGASRFAVFAFAVGAAAGIAALSSGMGNRWGMWDYRMGFTLLGWAAWAGAAGAVLSLAALAWAGYRRARAGMIWALVGLIAGALAFGLPWQMRQRARTVPPIHDITTDTEAPPRFVALVAPRQGAPNGVDYAGAAIAAQQKQAYPDIVPLTLNLPEREAFERCLKIARDLGWEVVAAVPGEGRIEATDTTRFFGFKDDVVIRVKAEGSGSRVDIRSESRVGRSDIGTNAKRIRAFLRAAAG